MRRYLWKKLLVLLALLLILAGCQNAPTKEVFLQPSKEPVPSEKPQYRKLEEGMEGEAVESLQKRLKELGYLECVPQGGMYDSDTFFAVKSFQNQNDLPVDGIASIQTQERLFSKGAAQCDPFSKLAPTVAMSFAELVMSDDGTRNKYPEGYPAVGTYKIIVDLEHQVTMVYTKDAEGNYTVPVRYMLCSTGKNDCTPKGTFQMDSYRVRFSQFARDKTYGQYWTQIRGAIYFHSILYSEFDTSTYIEEVWERFGQADSHGCVRLTVPDAKWMYYHIAPGTECVIRDGDPEDTETAAIREQLILAEAPDQRLRLEPSEIPDTDNWSVEDIPIEVEFVQGSQY